MIELPEDFRDLLVALAHAQCEFVVVGGHAIPIIGRGALLKNKRASGRTQDLADIEALEARRT